MTRGIRRVGTTLVREMDMATVPSAIAENPADGHTLPAFLRRVRIRGHPSIAVCAVRLHPLTILVGRNAAGKSSFLDALAFLRDVMKVGVTPALSFKPRGGWSSLLCRSANLQKIEIEIEACFCCARPFRVVRNANGP